MPSRSLPEAIRRGLTFWRRSIQARVVVSTMLLSALVVSVVGWFLLQQTRDGLVDSRVERVVAEARNETADARARLATVPGTDDEASLQLQQLVDPIITRGQSRGFSVVLNGPIGSAPTDLAGSGPRYSAGLDLRSVPEDLVRQLDTGDSMAWVFSKIRYLPDSGRADTPGIVVGSRIQLPADGEFYTIYYLYPMQQEAETLGLVTRALLTAGALLLVLVAGLAWLVTRQVVTPIRMARRVAERLAAGELEDRMRVRGDDDIARLATSFNQMASSLQRQIRQLEELSRVQRRFTSDVSHELRTPLTTVRMAGDVLHDAREDFDPATARAAELLQTELDRFEGLLTDLLEISRFDAGAAALDADDVNLIDIAHRIVDMTRPLAEQRNTTVTVRALSEPVLAEADTRRVERILRNLVSNAIDHAESRGIVILVNGDDHAAAVAVRDHGVGLAAGEAALVFNRFWRADPARARTSGGTGLGLAISLEDTHLHGGWLQAWGQPGRGSQFRLTLPRRAGGILRHSPLPLVPEDAEELA
ncbi:MULTISPECIES: MtrAB system histidine kinase MtrB [unclassified Nocardioides]|uniref:MtrAB system histidine kinase MtrB n=1 Tax=unclassified Nocardioides TaxID=2615069 RepID=UPI0006F8CC31|nr:MULTISPECIES: MtrAB system histidine kinase MtrB [unclassified Nocardioides]KQY56266.1 histidine kinase [Nocardioides sp. Root140]KRF10584.1 histidine kinase [Nocardioides sp. Soil796]